MSSQQQKPSLYPKIIDDSPSSSSLYSNPNPNPTPNLYPSLDMKELAENLFPDHDDEEKDKDTPPPLEETLIKIPGAILNLIDRHVSVDLAAGDFSVVRIRQGPTSVAVLARIADVQWPLTRDEPSVKLDSSHYFFSLFDPNDHSTLLNYGLTIPSSVNPALLADLDRVLAESSSFSVQKVDPVAIGVTGSEKEKSVAYWTTIAPNVEDYGGSAARLIAKGSGKLIQGILWCGDVTVDRLKWGEELLKKRIDSNEKSTEISKDALKRIKRVKTVTKMSESVVTGILSGVVKVSGFFTSTVVNSKAGKKFFGLLPGEIVLASLDGFAKICDAAEMAGKNVLQTSSTVTTGLVSHRYGEQAGEITNQSLGAAGHAMGTAWAVFKIRKAFNPKNSIKPSTLAKSAAKAVAAEHKTKQSKK